ncbi:uncharacterized protein LOC111779841 [Cucurbita pepo subsp. pepo]|uniref:uncharacterized protein LOC111779841 n=1 Tax=Cucurbita pepo subsp. pepo TaxID=3664 RepID=UPI000C9D3A43|nr:uncharacterized protein LOC111779841 [Cucurbita pepo subsp. pepo]
MNIQQVVLKSSFLPIFSTLSSKPNMRKVASLCTMPNIYARITPSVRENASTKTPTTIPPTSAYIHLPFCRKRCHYCDFPIVALGSSSSQTDDDPRIRDYVELLCREINATKSEFQTDRPLETVFFGGGTPSLVPPRLVSVILDVLGSKFGMAKNAEISIEMDPGTFDAKKMEGLMKLDVNRVSLGVQAFQEELLKACGRAHGVDEVYEAIEIIKSCGLQNWSMDLISSLPHQTAEMWEESLRLTIEAQPTHVSVYDLQVEEDTKFGILYKPGEFPLPSDTDSAGFYRMASKALAEGGYSHYEISSYCKSGFECKHNSTYWKNNPFYGFGLGAASYLGSLRFSRPRKLKEYTSYVQNLEKGLVDCHGDNDVDIKDMAMDVVMLSLRTSSGLDLQSFGKAYGGHLVHSLCRAYEPYIKSGHVVCLDEQRRALTVDECNGLLSSKDDSLTKLRHIRLSDPDGFLLSNELISLAFRVISP